jgi:hypothetical protein
MECVCGQIPNKLSLTTFRNPRLTKMCCINEWDHIFKENLAEMWTHWHPSSECISHIIGNSEIWESNRFVNEESNILGFFWLDVWTDRPWRWRQWASLKPRWLYQSARYDFQDELNLLSCLYRVTDSWRNAQLRYSKVHCRYHKIPPPHLPFSAGSQFHRVFFKSILNI